MKTSLCFYILLCNVFCINAEASAQQKKELLPTIRGHRIAYINHVELRKQYNAFSQWKTEQKVGWHSEKNKYKDSVNKEQVVF